MSIWLRRHMARGGLFGVPLIVRAEWASLPLTEVEPAIYLPDHPIFKRLAIGLEPF